MDRFFKSLAHLAAVDDAKDKLEEVEEIPADDSEGYSLTADGLLVKTEYSFRIELVLTANFEGAVSSQQLVDKLKIELKSGLETAMQNVADDLSLDNVAVHVKPVDFALSINDNDEEAADEYGLSDFMDEEKEDESGEEESQEESQDEESGEETESSEDEESDEDVSAEEGSDEEGSDEEGSDDESSEESSGEDSGYSGSGDADLEEIEKELSQSAADSQESYDDFDFSDAGDQQDETPKEEAEPMDEGGRSQIPDEFGDSYQEGSQGPDPEDTLDQIIDEESEATSDYDFSDESSGESDDASGDSEESESGESERV